MSPARPASAVLALAAAAALAGCDRSPVTHVRDRTLNLRLDEFSITPQRIRAKAGRLTIVATDVGRLNHNVLIRRRKAPLAGMQTLRPGGTGRITVTLKPGAYRIYCSVSRHEDLGEYGTLVVTR